MRFIPVDVLGTKAISSGSAPTKRRHALASGLAAVHPRVPVDVPLLELAGVALDRLADGAGTGAAAAASR